MSKPLVSQQARQPSDAFVRHVPQQASQCPGRRRSERCAFEVNNASFVDPEGAHGGPLERVPLPGSRRVPGAHGDWLL